MSDAILLVDDEPSVLSAICRSLRGEPYEVVTELSAEQALVRMCQQEFKVVVSDERMALMQGSEFLGIVRKRYPGTVRILLTGHATLDAAVRAVNEGGIFKFLTKPWNDADLKTVIRDALKKFELEHEAWKIFALLQKKEDNIEGLEAQFPGISHIDRDNDGSLVLPDMSDDELELLRMQCERAFIEPGAVNSPASHVYEILRHKISTR